MAEQEKIRNWIQNGIDKNAVDQAFLWGWNLVCPNDSISALTTELTYTKKGRNGATDERIRKPFEKFDLEELQNFVGKNKSDSLTTSQIRIAFGEMRRIQMNGYSKGTKTDFLLLKPKLAYAVKRHDKKGLTAFYRLFVTAYDAVDTTNDENGKKHFENLMNLMEAVLAYHKYHGGKE